MSANISLILNVLLLIGVIIAISKVLKNRKQQYQNVAAPSSPRPEMKSFDDIIAVRKIYSDEEAATQEIDSPKMKLLEPENIAENGVPEPKTPSMKGGPSLMIILMSKQNRQLAGYELLQTLLAAGLRFGDGQLFHRHQYPNGQGPVLCSLAAATATGMFDLQNIGAFSTRGLCLFMDASGNPTIDAERFAIMLETAQQLCEDLDTQLLDETQQLLTNTRLQRYYQRLNIAPAALADGVNA